MTLHDLHPGATATVRGFSEALPDAHRRRLEDLGFLPGVEVMCRLAPSLRAPRVYSVLGSVYSLDAEIAASVDVVM